MIDGSKRPTDEHAQREFRRYQRFGVPANPFGGLLELVVVEPVYNWVQRKREQRANAAAAIAVKQLAAVENLPSDL